jgi:hypothetical protein
MSNRIRRSKALDCFKGRAHLLLGRGTAPVHRSVPPTSDETVVNECPGQYLFLQCDASVTGLSAILTIGTNWWNARPVSHYSRKLKDCEHNYPVHDQELLAAFEGFQKYFTKLMGREFIVLTDNTTLARFMDTGRVTPRNVRVHHFLAPFTFKIHHIKGESNVLADVLSRQFEDGYRISSSQNTLESPFVGLDVELGAIDRPTRAKKAPRRFAEEEQPLRPEVLDYVHGLTFDDPDAILAPAEATAEDATPKKQKKKRSRKSKRESTKQERRLAKIQEHRAAQAWETPDEEAILLDPAYESEFQDALTTAYDADVTFRKIVRSPFAPKTAERTTAATQALLSTSPSFKMSSDGLLWRRDEQWGSQLCVPDTTIRGRKAREVIMEHVHKLGGHSGGAAFSTTMQRKYWWASIVDDCVAYARSCPSCQATKDETSTARSPAHPMPLPYEAYKDIGIDFQGPFVISDYRGQVVDSLFNFVDIASGEVIIVPVMMDNLTSEKCAEIWLREVYPQWGMPKVIRSDRDRKFVAEFWQKMHKLLGTTLAMSSSYHPRTNGGTERKHRDINAMMRQLISDEHSDWASHIPIIQFAMNSHHNKSRGYSAFELSRVRPPTAFPTALDLTREDDASNFIARAQLRQQAAHNALAKAQIDQTHQSNKHRRPDHVPTLPNDSNEGSTLYWISTTNLTPVTERNRKHAPRFEGPFKCLHYDPATSTYELELPARFTTRGISNVFHGSVLRPFIPSDEKRFPNRITDKVPLFPLDANTVTVTRIREHYYKRGQAVQTPNGPVRPYLLHLIAIDSTGESHHFQLPHPDFTNQTQTVIDYLADKKVAKLEDLPNSLISRKITA